jgi:polysaccharide export outer membrane protein
LAGPKTLFDVLVLAGGASKPGNGATVTLTRRLTNGAIVHPDAHQDSTGRFSMVEMPLEDVLQGDTDAANIRVIANDTVAVNEGKRSRAVYITGDVAKPGQIDLVTQDSVSLLRALALAGGLNKTAKKRATIMHVRDDGVRTAMAEIDLSQIIKGKVPDVELIPGDILMIESSGMSAYVGQATNSAILSGFLLLGRL